MHDAEEDPAELTVILPEEPPTLHPAAARALWNLLLDAHERLEAQQSSDPSPTDTATTEAGDRTS